MEAASVEAGEKNHLLDALSETEIAAIPNIIADKLNTYIDKKFEEYLTSKALHETSKSQIDEKNAATDATIIELTAKYEDTLKKLQISGETITDLQNQVISLNTELEKAREKIKLLENEAISLKSSRDAAVDERNDLTRIVERRNVEVERLIANEKSLTQQLHAAVESKCKALALNDEIQSKEMALQYREKRLDQERVLLNSQISALSEEVTRLTSELQSVRLNQTSRLVTLETQLTEKCEELKAANQTIEQLNEMKQNLNNRAENLTQRLMEQREIENKMTENYKKELDAKTKLSDLFKTMREDSESKCTELAEGISELQKLLNEATEQYGDLETKYKQTEKDHDELMEKKNEIISTLKNELEHANDLLKAATEQNLDMALNELAPSAATASKLLKSGMSLTQIYSLLVTVTDELNKKKEENRQLQVTINKIVQELEEKAPMLQKQKTEYIEIKETNVALTQQIDSLVIECNKLREDYCEASRISNHYGRENNRLKGELADLGRQVCFLLKEIEHTRGGLLNGDHDSSRPADISNSSDMSSSRIISKTLVTFSDIQELQANNQKLLRMIRDLTDKQEELERRKEQFDSGEMEKKIETLKQRVTELNEAQDRQTKMVNGLIRQRDMFKKLYHDHMKGKRHEVSSVIDTSDLETDESLAMDVSHKSPKPAAVVVSNCEVKCKELEKELQLLREEYKTYKEEKVTNEKMLFEQIDNMRQEIAKLTAANSKCAATAEYNNERLKILQTNIATYKKQISSLEEKNKAYNATIAKHEVSLQHLRDEVLNSQGKLAAAEIQVENLRLENKLVKDAEMRLQTEKEILNKDRQSQSLLFTNLELLKTSLERVGTENKARIETRLDEATRECAALRRRLQEEQDRFRELAVHLERETATTKSRMQEEKDAADAMRKEIEQLRNDLINKNKANEEVNKKLKVALSPNTDGSLDTIKKIKELEIKLSDRDGEIKSLVEQLNTAKEHIKQYCDIAENAEKELKNLNSEYEKYKLETGAKLTENSERLQILEDKCSELEAELSLHANGEYTNANTELKNELSNVKDELKNALTNYDKCRTELDETRNEIIKLSETVQQAEEKYTNEMILHSSDIQTLSTVKAELSRAQNQLNELVAFNNSTNEKMEAEKLALIEREKIAISENEQLSQRLKDLNDQNSLLHEQIQALGTQLSVTHASKSYSESMNESANNSSINLSISEEDGKSSEQLLQIVKLLRKEKDIAVAKYDILQAEIIRLKSQLEITEKQLDSCKLSLASEREKSEVSMITVNKQSDILRKVETLNALTDSNRILREERNSLNNRVEELTLTVKSLEEKLTPLEETIADYTSKNETLLSENTALKADCVRWRTRVNALVERANKTSPEDWKRLQNERETLAKMLTNEKENFRKISEELGALKVEKSKLEEQYSILSRQHNSVVEENKKLNEELQVLKDDMSRLTEELSKLKGEYNTATDTNARLTEEITNREASLTDIRNKENQIRKIAKKYKGQYEELVKSVEEEKQKKEGEAAAADAALAESAKRVEEQLGEVQKLLDAEKVTNEKLKQEIETLKTANTDKEEKARQVLKQAKVKIVQLTEMRNSLNRELDESRTKIGTIEQSTRDEHDARLELIKSQYEGRISRLEKERVEAQTEKTREVESLMQKVNLLQRQLANQTSGSKQQTTTEKTTTDPPTANIKPMAGVAQQSVSGSRRGGETPLASIRPMAQVGPTAPHDAHSTEYMPASSSRPLPRAALAASASAAAPAPATSAAAVAPPESTQDMDTSEAGGAGSSDSTAQSSSHSQPPQQAVALVLPRIEQPSAAGSAVVTPAASSAPPAASAASAAPQAAPAAPGAVSGGPSSASAPGQASGVSTSHAAPLVSTSHAAPGVSTSHAAPGVTTSHPAPGVSTSHAAPGVSTSHVAPGVSTSHVAPGVSTSHVAPGVSTSHAPPDVRPPKRRLQQRPLTAKRTRVQGFERSVEVEYQVPTSSRCDQDDEGVIVVDSEEDDERCTGTMYREGEEDEDMEEEQEVEGGEEEEEADGDDAEHASTRQESPAQSPVAGGVEGEEGEGGARAAHEPDSDPAPAIQQIEAISSGTEPSGTLSLGGNGADDGDDSIVPSTPTLYVPRRNDGFGEAVVSPLGGAGAGAAGAEGAGARFTFAEAGGAASHHDTHADLAAALPPPHARAEGTESREWEESRGEEEAAAVSSQGSEPSSPHQVAEEGREAEASAAPRRPAPSPHPPHQRWMRAADSESSPRGRGMRRGRPARRSHNYTRF
ncbi:nucleoprotein TPR isoform X2 [Bicyclus anynana]|uniref:Nucleoprotein TPR n=1 Tax=Bicyclus anynana TaxID=110368 RepID=A0ABM3LRR9_BICAN|nr:nucleoprotein TPR isoform X2 [Bicyclus anynana]